MLLYWQLALVAIGGAIGSALRYLTLVWYERSGIVDSPFLATLTVNIVGSFFMGFLLAGFLGGFSHYSSARLLLTTGLLGGFTTFSAFSAETIFMLEKSKFALAFAYVSTSLMASLFAAFLGLMIGRYLLSGIYS